MKHIKVWLIALCCVCTAYNACAQKTKYGYRESRYINRETPHVLRMEYAYNERHKVDEEYWGSMTIVLHDTAAAKHKGTLKLNEDEKIISCDYDYSSAWVWHGGGKILDGTVQLIKWNAQGVTVKINFVTSKSSSGMYPRFSGTHTYKFK